MSDTPALRLPSSPYPGLRPFLDHEEMLMYGRQAQVEDVVRRLGRTEAGAAPEGGGAAPAAASRFVAVLGGSGSGKSSLIRAGVVPYLRQFGIPAAGDLWETVVATPGTNFQADADGVVHESPITRLARKFERVLRGGHQPARCEAIAQTLRRPGGLGLMIGLYAPELNLPEGVDPAKACVMLVIDQFEELFHKTNVDRPDARQLIERVIDHYHQASNGSGNDRCYLAITMRSEHLNDCAGYLGLPEAINAGSYLVSRLDDAQVREVIEKPAQRYLRLRQRERQALARQEPPVDVSAMTPLPRSVAIEPAVIHRLVRDTSLLANNPDHLPLLQHVLSRTWDMALLRQGRQPHEVPDDIILSDLWRAARANADTPVPDAQNVLSSSLDGWAEQLLNSHPPEQRGQMLDLFRRLAYKDPRSGTYNQQRLYVASHPLGQDGVHALVAGRWVESVDYLYWDAEDPSRVTLKVSHESFIRGWKTLRELADNEALRLEQFLALLAATRTWTSNGERDTDVMDVRLLGLMKAARVEEALGPIDAAHDAQPESFTWHEWHGWLGQLPQGQALLGVPRADVRRFYRQSEHVLERDLARGRKNRMAISALSMAVVVTLVGTAFSLLVQQPVIDRAELYFKAANLANRTTLRNAYEQIGGSQDELRVMLDAAELLTKAQRPEATHYAGISDAVLHGPWSPLKNLRLASVLSEAARAIEPSVNGKLRALLTRSVWRTGTLESSRAAGELIDGENSPPEYNRVCSGLQGTLKPVEGDRSRDAVRRGVFVSSGRLSTAGADPDGRKADQESLNRLMYTATVNANDECTLGQQLLALPSERQPAVMFDAVLSYMVLAVDGEKGAPPTVSIHRVVWEDPDSGRSAEIHQALAWVYNAKTAEALRRQVPLTVGMAGATWRAQGGRAMRVGDEDWRLVADGQQRLVPSPAGDALRPLAEDPTDRACESLRQPVEQDVLRAGTTSPDGRLGQTRVALYRDGRACLAILRTEVLGSAVDDPAKTRDLVTVRAYVRPANRDLDEQGKLIGNRVVISSFEFGRVRRDITQWYAGVKDKGHEGWLAYARPPTKRDPVTRYNGSPWSTAALHQLGQEVLKDHMAEQARWAARPATVAQAMQPLPPTAPEPAASSGARP